MSSVSVLPLDPTNYSRHALHAEECAWVEKNCYIDIWIEVLHALELNPLPIAPFVLAVDFEDDQWTFFKPPHNELWDLYGLDVQELNVWRPILDQAVTHLGSGKLISTEADAYYLPDTQGTDYRTSHTKTTIVINDVDIEKKRLGYFHNAGYFALEGEDFDKLFRVGAEPDPTFMPLFAEFIRIDRIKHLSEPELATRSVEILRRHLERRPVENPIRRFGQRFAGDIGQLQEQGLEAYHAWAFATIRQLGASFEMASVYLEWLEQQTHLELAPAAQACNQISASSKALILKAARAVTRRKPVDFEPMFAEMSQAWDQALELLVVRSGV